MGCLFVDLTMSNNEYVIPANTSNGFKGSEFLVNNILEITSSSSWVTCKKKSEIVLIYSKNMKVVTTE